MASVAGTACTRFRALSPSWRRRSACSRLHAGSAAAAPGLLVGASDDMFKLEPGRANSFAEDLGPTSARVTLWWQAGRTALTGTEAAQLQAAASTRRRIALAGERVAGCEPTDWMRRGTRIARSCATRSCRFRASTTSSSGTSRLCPTSGGRNSTRRGGASRRPRTSSSSLGAGTRSTPTGSS